MILASFMEIPVKYGRMARNPWGSVMFVLRQRKQWIKAVETGIYVFSARNGDAPNIVEMLIQHKLRNVSTESRANHNLMLEGVFESVTEATEC